MRVVVQRVGRAEVTVGGEVVGSIGRGLLLLTGIAQGDSEADVAVAAEKVANLRIFADEEGRMNLSLLDVGGAALVVSQFTLLAVLARGRRPSFTGAAAPDRADQLIGCFVDALGEAGVPTETGRFGARMEVELVNEGPVTLVLETRDGRVT